MSFAAPRAWFATAMPGFKSSGGLGVVPEIDPLLPEALLPHGHRGRRHGRLRDRMQALHAD
jgi:hypothetical protein